jgi:peptidoglycan/LPS O-acetylase OafA/YrhL
MASGVPRVLRAENRIRSMDFLRSIAILSVLLAHTVLGFGAPEILAPLQLGGIGVDLFFVLSGWLLGGQLFKEMENGSINIRRFWLRRWIRTLPAYYVVLIMTVAQQWFTKEEPASSWKYFVFIQNYDYPLEIFSVSWSLAVEEQFYLLIAPFFAFSLFMKPNMRLAVLVIFLLFPSVFRQLGWFDSDVETHIRLDGCIAGVLLAAIKYQHNILWEKFVNFSGLIAFIGVLVILLSFYQRWFPVVWFDDPSYLALAVIFGSWVIYANSNDIVGRNLYIPGSYYIATRSYSIYLLHPDAIAITNRLPFEFSFFIYISIVFLVSLFSAEILYRFVEIPFMYARSKLRWAN